jgi:hypothetical protein
MARQALVVLIVVIVFGILMPLYKGTGFLDPRIIAAYSLLAPLFVAPASAELASNYGKDAPASGILTRIGIIVAWGWGITVVILATAIVTLNLARGGAFAVPPLEFISAILAFSLTASIAIAILGAVLAGRFSAAQVKAILRSGFLIFLLALVFAPRLLPGRVTLAVFDHFSTRRALTHLAWEAFAACAAIAAVLLLLLLKSARGGARTA